MVAFKRAVVRELGRGATGVLLDPEIGAAQAIVDGSLPPGCGLLVADRGHRLRRSLDGAGQPGPRRLERRQGEADGRLGAPSSSSTTTRTPPTRPTRSAWWPRSRPTCVAGRPCRCSSSHSRSRSTRAVPAARRRGPRRRVVVETARRLTALGGDILKAEFPYDPGVTDEGRWREACAELDEASRLPWVLLSGGVDDATFEAQVRVACGAGRERGPRRAVRVGRGGDARAGGSGRLPGTTGGSGWPGWSTWWTSSADAVARPARAARRAARSPARAGIAGTRRDLGAPVRPARGRRAEPGHPRRRVRTRSPVFGQVETIVDAIRLEIGSSSAIAACGAARLGLRMAFVGVVGDDPSAGSCSRRSIGAASTSCGCRIDPDVPTGATVILSRGEDRAEADRARGDRRAAGERRPARAAGRGAPPPRREHVPPAGRSLPACRTSSREARALGLDDVVRLQLGPTRAVGRRDRPAAPRGRRVPAEPRGGAPDHRSDRVTGGGRGARPRARPTGRAPGRPFTLAIKHGAAGAVAMRGTWEYEVAEAAGPAGRGRRHDRRGRLLRCGLPVRDARAGWPLRDALELGVACGSLSCRGSGAPPPSRRSPRPGRARRGRSLSGTGPMRLVAVAPNPSIDRLYELDRLRPRRGQPAARRDAGRRGQGAQRRPRGACARRRGGGRRPSSPVMPGYGSPKPSPRKGIAARLAWVDGETRTCLGDPRRLRRDADRAATRPVPRSTRPPGRGSSRPSGPSWQAVMSVWSRSRAACRREPLRRARRAGPDGDGSRGRGRGRCLRFRPRGGVRDAAVARQAQRGRGGGDARRASASRRGRG